MDAATRKWKRIKVDVRVRIRRVDEPESTTSVVRTYELSRSGMSVYASEALEVGAATLRAVSSVASVPRPVRNRFPSIASSRFAPSSALPAWSALPAVPPRSRCNFPFLRAPPLHLPSDGEVVPFSPLPLSRFSRCFFSAVFRSLTSPITGKPMSLTMYTGN